MWNKTQQVENVGRKIEEKFISGSLIKVSEVVQENTGVYRNSRKAAGAAGMRCSYAGGEFL